MRAPRSNNSDDSDDDKQNTKREEWDDGMVPSLCMSLPSGRSHVASRKPCPLWPDASRRCRKGEGEKEGAGCWNRDNVRPAIGCETDRNPRWHPEGSDIESWTPNPARPGLPCPR